MGTRGDRHGHMARECQHVIVGCPNLCGEEFPRARHQSLNLSSMPKGYSAANSEYLTSTERKRLQAASVQQQQRAHQQSQAAQYRA